MEIEDLAEPIVEAVTHTAAAKAQDGQFVYTMSRDGKYLTRRPLRVQSPKSKEEKEVRNMSEKETVGKVKKELLKHYASGDIHKFLQLDGWYVDYESDAVVRPDEDGDWLSMTNTRELRHSPPDLAVRVLIHEGTKHEDAVRLLKKLTEWFDNDSDIVAELEKFDSTEHDKRVHESIREPIEAELASQRQEATRIKDGKPPGEGQLTTTVKGKVRDIVATKVGLSGKTYQRAKKIDRSFPLVELPIILERQMIRDKKEKGES